MANFEMPSGDTKLLEVTTRNPQGAVIDITGREITWGLSPDKHSTVPLISKTVGNGITIVDGPAGRFDIKLDPDDTLDLQGVYYHEALLNDNGTISTIMSGDAKILATLL